MQLIPLRKAQTQTLLPLVLIHGWGHSSAIWGNWLQHYSPARAIFGINLPGFTPGEAEPATPVSQAGALDQLSALLPDACILMGWSLGGMLACQLAQSPKVKGLLTLAANPSFIARPHWPSALAPEVLAQFQQSFSEDPVATVQRFNQLQAQGHSNRKAVLASLKALTPEIKPAAWAEALNWLGQIDNSNLHEHLQIPQRHLFAEQDALVPSSAADWCPHSRRIPGGHLLPLDAIEPISQALADLDRAQNRATAQAFSRAANAYDQHASLQQRLGAELIEHLTPTPKSLLDLGCGTGFIARTLNARTGGALPWIVNLDLAWGMLQTLPVEDLKLQADAEQLPFADGSFEAITANLALQWCNLPVVLSEAKRCLALGGRLIFNTLAEGTLNQISRAWGEVDSLPHVNNFPSQAAILEQCQGAGFSQVSWQASTQRVYAADLKSLLMTIKGIGAKNQQPERFKGLMSAARWRAFSDAMHKYAWDGEGWFVSYEVLTLCLRA